MTSRRVPSARLAGMKESQIREMTRIAMDCGAINLAQGFPDYQPPLAVREAASQAVMEGWNQYTVTWGIRALREEILASLSGRYPGHFDWADPDRHVTICCGVSEGIVSAMLGTVDPGDEVIIVEPAHENYAPAVRFAGGVPVFVPLLRPEYVLDLDRIEEAISPRSKVLLFNTPNNPTGRVFTREELSGLARLCTKHDLLAVSDEIYDRILYDGRTHVPLMTLPDMSERTIMVGGLGKTYAITGWRLGYMVARDPWSTAARTIHDFTTICAPAPLQHAAAVAALRLPESFYSLQLAEYHERRDTMMEALGAAGFEALPPEGAYYLLADYEKWDVSMDGAEFSRYLTREVGVAVVDGASFYETPGAGRGLVRFAFAKKLETLAEARKRLVEGFRKSGRR